MSRGTNRLPERFLRWYCKICKKNIVFEITDEFREQIKKEATFFPFPVIFQHSETCYTILHLDPDLNDRGTINTRVFNDIHELPEIVPSKQNEKGSEPQVDLSSVSSGASLDSLKQLEQLSNISVSDSSKGSSGSAESAQDATTKLSLDQLSSLTLQADGKDVKVEGSGEQPIAPIKKTKKITRKTSKSTAEKTTSES